MESSSSKASTKCKKGKEKAIGRAEWTEPQRAYLVSLLVEYGAKEYRKDNGWTNQAWNEITKKWTEKFPGANYTRSQIKDQEQHLKKKLKALKQLMCSNSGLGWNSELKRVEAIDDVWEDLLKKNKEARQWHNRNFPYYDDLCNLYEGRSDCVGRNKKAKTSGKTFSPFNEDYFAFRREETNMYVSAMKEMNDKKRNEKYGISAAMKAFKELEGFSFDDYDKATTLFMASAEIREAFLTFDPHERALWIKKRIDNMN